jgi:putative holliday junction resolvase
VTSEPGAILGIDVGSRRIGLAIAEAGALSAQPLATLVVGGRSGREEDAVTGPDPRTLAAIETVVRDQRVREVVVGLPLEASGNHGPMAEASRLWASALGERLGLPVTLRDERLSSSIAESRLGPMPRGRAGGPPSRSQRERYRARVDREAAAIILQDELDARRSARP